METVSHAALNLDKSNPNSGGDILTEHFQCLFKKLNSKYRAWLDV